MYYKKQRCDINLYAKEITVSEIKPLLIIRLCVFPVMVYFLLIGLFVDKEAFNMGIPLLCFFIAIYFIYSIKYINVKRKIIEEFDKEAINDIIEILCFVKNEEYNLVWLNSKNTMVFSSNDINRIKYTKRLILIKLFSGVVVYIIKNEESSKLFGE